MLRELMRIYNRSISMSSTCLGKLVLTEITAISGLSAIGSISFFELGLLSPSF